MAGGMVVGETFTVINRDGETVTGVVLSLTYGADSEGKVCYNGANVRNEQYRTMWVRKPRAIWTNDESPGQPEG